MRRIAAALAITLSQSVIAVEVGSPVPELKLPRLDDPTRTIDLAHLRGQVVYVDFWASWCVPCRISMPALVDLYKAHPSGGFIVVGVNKDVSIADARGMLAKVPVPVTFPLIQDTRDVAAKAFDVKTMPSGYLIDRKGIVRKVHRGFTEKTAQDLRAEVDELMKESP